jgi:hypothetical protein
MNTKLMRIIIGTVLMNTIVYSSTAVQAVTVPFTEHFADDVSNWADPTGLALLTYVSSGGPDDSSYASTDFAFDGAGGGEAGSSVVLFRGQDEFASSDDAFFGNWIADGVGRMTAQVRHNAPLPLNFFVRFSGPGNFPGAVAVQFVPVFPNTWTTLDFDMSHGNPHFVTFEGSNYGAVFSNVGHLQIGVSIPAALAEDTTAYTFGLDQVSVLEVPEPSAWLLALGAAAGISAWRRRRAR